ncbi:MAG: hypothetical protein Q8R28_10405 [Dehalococcoidia bacterium]|nr:hypothetical protein [Dehalococcoidia bacterium]
MGKYTVINKSFSKVQIRCYANEILCYQDADAPGMSLAEYLGYVIDTTKGKGRCTDGKYALHDVQISIRMLEITLE